MFAGVAAAGLALAGCGSDGGPSQADLDAERERTEQQMMMVTQLQNQINALRTQLGLPEDGNLGTSIQGLQDEVTRLQGEIDRMAEAERMAAEEEARKMAAATGKALYAALAGPDPTSQTALDNIAAPTLTSTLAIDAASGAGSLADGTDPGSVSLRAGDAVAALGSWKGMDYALTTGTGDDKVTNEARVYTNRGTPGTQPFSGTGGKYTLTDGSLAVADTEAARALVMAAAFTHSGTQTHEVPDKSDAVYIRGTYDGAPGEYSCTASCTSTNDGSGSPSGLGGTWTFTPDKGAMVSQPDAHYLYYGWWVSKDKDGGPTAASAFAGRFGTDSGDSTDGLDDAGDISALTGSASYAGSAVGKWALDYSLNKATTGTSDGGHFTADANFEATFSGANPGVTGTIDNFRLNDGTEDPGWSVALARGALGSSGGSITAPAASMTGPTVWSIGGTAAPASGTWSGTMYDEAVTGDADDGNTIPTTMTGTFYSEYEDVGRLVGAFGADKE